MVFIAALLHIRLYVCIIKYNFHIHSFQVDEITSQNRVLVHYRDLVGAEPVPFILASEEGLNSLGELKALNKV